MLICRYVIQCLGDTNVPSSSSLTIFVQHPLSPSVLLILTRGVITAAFPLFGIQMYQALGFQWATGLLAFLTLVMLPFPYIFFKYGARIRARSRFATSS